MQNFIVKEIWSNGRLIWLISGDVLGQGNCKPTLNEEEALCSSGEGRLFLHRMGEAKNQKEGIADAMVVIDQGWFIPTGCVLWSPFEYWWLSIIRFLKQFLYVSSIYIVSVFFLSLLCLFISTFWELDFGNNIFGEYY